MSNSTGKEKLAGGDGKERPTRAATQQTGQRDAPEKSDHPPPAAEEVTRRHDAPTSQGAQPDLSARIERALDQEPPYVRRDPLLGRTIANRFVVESKIGAGGMGAVYRARQLGMDRDVAIKVLLHEFATNATIIKRFHMEALAVSRLQHPNTIRIFDFGQTEDKQLFIAMEFLRGRSLEHELRAHKSLAVNKVLHVISQVCGSLSEAHDKGIIHRDLKPDNIFLCPVGKDENYAKVLDFGVAKLKAEDHRQGTLTQAGMVFGTPKYMSPEQSRSASTDARSDIYALGVIMYEMITGRAPFEADNPLSILIMHVQEPIKPFDVVRPDLLIPAALQRTVYRCLEKHPDKRFESVQQLGDELEAIAKALDSTFDRVVTRGDAEALGIDVARDEAFTLPDPSPGKQRMENLQGRATERMSREERDALVRREFRRRVQRRLALATMALLGLLGGAGLLFRMMLPAQPVGFQRLLGSPAIAPTALPAFSPDKVSLILDSEPPGATIYADEQPLGRSPIEIVRLRESREAPFTFRLDGHQSITLAISFAEDGRYDALLPPREPEPVIEEAPGRPERRPTRPARRATGPTAEPEEPREPVRLRTDRVLDIKTLDTKQR